MIGKGMVVGQIVAHVVIVSDGVGRLGGYCWVIV